MNINVSETVSDVLGVRSEAATGVSRCMQNSDPVVCSSDRRVQLDFRPKKELRNRQINNCY
jgi:hypothetical protein